MVSKGQTLGLHFDYSLDEPLDLSDAPNRPPQFPRIPWFDGGLFAAYIDEVDGKMIERLEGDHCDFYFLCEVRHLGD